MSRFAFCHFCDDVRSEVGNKMSLMGVYGGELFVRDFPTVLPKLCILAYCSTSAEKPIKSLTLRVFQGQSVLLEASPPPQTLEDAPERIAKTGSEDEPIQYLSYGLHGIMTPFVIQEPATLTVVMIADGEEILAGKLRLKKAPTPAS